MTATAPHTGHPVPIIAARRRPVALAVAVLAAAALATMSVAFHDASRPTAFDSEIARRLDGHVGGAGAQALLGCANPYLAAALSVAVVVGAWAARRRDAAVAAVIAPLLAIGLTELALKPLVGRHLALVQHGRLHVFAGESFPSGHITGIATVAVECAVLVLRAPIAVRWRALAVAVLTAWTVAGSAGVVRHDMHYATDTLGAMCVSAVCVLGTALTVDSLTSTGRNGDDLDARERP